jgi:hypothetical protein
MTSGDEESETQTNAFVVTQQSAVFLEAQTISRVQ